MSHQDDHQHEPGDGTKKADGLGAEGTIPNEPNGLGATTGEPSTFEPEEDEHAEPDSA